MTTPQRLTATKALILAGILLSYGSYGVYKLGGPIELYPFFYWRLYSAPVGADVSVTHRIYARGASDAAWQRLPVRPTRSYPRKEYAWQLESLVGKALRDSLDRTDARERVALFAREVAPDAAEHRIVAEIIYPQALAKGIIHYDTTTVFHFAR